METIWIIFLLATGACIGSFLNVVIYRMPRRQSIAFPPSCCPNCGRAIRWYDNIPILSWLLLRGQCRDCKVRISPRYLIIEAAGAVLLTGLFICYFVLEIRDGAGRFPDAWPMFAAHAALLFGLLACSIVDIDNWIVPLEVCWFVSLVGLASATAAPHPFIPTVGPAVGAMSLAGAIGLTIGLALLRGGIIRQSFIDAGHRPSGDDAKDTGVAITTRHGVNPRKEVLREVVFLAPAILLGLSAYLLVTRVGIVAEVWGGLIDAASGGPAAHFNAFLSAIFGYLIGGLLIWGMRILGTLGFGKEAMGLGDVHLLAAVGAVTGWFVPSIAFFVAPIFALESRTVPSA